MVKIEIDIQQIKKAIERLPERQRVQLAQELVKNNETALWKKILRDIDKRVKKFPVSQEAIGQEIRACRKHKHASPLRGPTGRREPIGQSRH